MNRPGPKTPRDSAVEARYIVMPQHANELGIAFGGTIMSWIDIVGAMVAQRHCGMKVVTVGVDRISFLAPVHVGEHVVVRASANYVGRTSMEVGVQVIKENPFTGEQVRATTAYLTFVAFDPTEKPVVIPALHPETPEEIRRHENAKLRRAARLEYLQKRRPAAQGQGEQAAVAPSLHPINQPPAA